MSLLKKIILMTSLALPALALTAGSPKRGVCWDEGNLPLGATHARLLSEGVSWVYNWGPDARNPEIYDETFSFQPMAWNGAYNATRIKAWLKAHPETRYLLGFNEPNFADQARMTPAAAAASWPALEAIAAEFGVKLVAPVLNFSGSQVGGKVWSPYEWYDEFFRLLPDAKVDLLALHCYMNWYGSNTWFATEYFYSDLYNRSKECYGRYPNLVAFLDRYKAAHGHFPRMMLTEFCSWENDGSITGVDFQIDQMTQKVQKLEQSDLVEGYAWFMANDSKGAGSYPYMSLLQRNTADSPLSDLGKVYVSMSAFDKEKFYSPGERIEAKDYVNATTDDQRIRVRPNSEASSALPLQIEIPASGYADYQINVPSDGTYRFLFHVKTQAATKLVLYVDSRKSESVSVPSTDGVWRDVEIVAPLTAGHHTVMPYNSGSASLWVNALSFDTTGAVGDITAADAEITEVFTLGGISLGKADINSLAPGFYPVRLSDGKNRIIKVD